MADVCVIDYWPDDEDGLSLHVHTNIHWYRSLSLGQDWAAVHIDDIAPGGGAKHKQGVYRFPFTVDTIIRLREAAKLENCVFTEDFYEYATRVVADSVTSSISMKRINRIADACKVPKDAPEEEREKAKALLAAIPERVVSPSGRQPFNHQKVMREAVISLSNAAILGEPGTGKTFSVAQGLEWRFRRNHIDRAIVVCPVSLIDNWEREINDHTMLCAVGLSQASSKAKLHELDLNWNTNQVFIINYESVHAIQEYLDMHLDWHRVAIVADETTKIKSPHAKRSRVMHLLGRKARYKYMLTGTPVTQGAHDIFSQYKFLDGGETFGLSNKRFIEKYFWRNSYARGPGQLEPQPGAIDTISDLMFSKGVRFTKKECLDLPEKMWSRRIVRLPEYQKEIYNRIQIDALLKIEDTDLEVSAPIVLVEMLRLAQVTSGHVNGKRHKTEQEIMVEMINEGKGYVDPEVKETVYFKEQPKIEMLKNVLKDELEHESVVVWSRFIPERKLIKDMLIENKIPFTSFDTHGRQEAVDLFQDGKVKVFVGNPASGGHGITLTAASHMIFMSNSFSLEQRTQAEDRIHRIGQRTNCHYIDIVVDNSIDDKVLNRLRDKFDVATTITRDGARAFLETNYSSQT